MAKWLVHEPTHRITQNVEHQDATDIQKKTNFCVFRIFIFFIVFFIHNFLNDFSKTKICYNVAIIIK